ncbi:MAG TPA: hypothetical protein VLK79_12750 [Gaiellales bacterium]|nr:hypothetical protein [Gaiellales bacterium]
MAWIAPILAGAGETAGTVGSALGSAAGAVGSALGTAGGALGSLAGEAAGAIPGIGSLGEGLQSLFGGGEAGHLAALGQAVPEGVELVGPSATFAGPGFIPSAIQGYMGTLGQYASPSAGTQVGGGLGQIFAALQAIQGSPSGMGKLGQIVRLGDRAMSNPGVSVLPLPQVPTAPQGPIMKMIGGLFQGF